MIPSKRAIGRSAAAVATARLSTRGALIALVRRLHFYIGWLVGPFLLVAAASGLLYAASPQIEAWWYAPQLTAPAQGTPQLLAAQISAARQVVGDDATLAAVRPSPAPGRTTRVMFDQPGAGPSVHRAIFVDPVSTGIRGDLPVYGTSGTLPWRAAIDQFHRSLWLGDTGRLYSELAASWLWLAALGGLLLWGLRRVRRRPATVRARAAGWHARLGPWLLIGLLFLSVTGLTWSQYAGARIGVLRAAWGWQTPSVDTQLARSQRVSDSAVTAHHGSQVPGVHTGQQRIDAATFDRILADARAHGIDAARLEVRPPTQPGRAWTVAEIDRGWPTQVDAVAIDARNDQVVDSRRFADYPLAAKLTRWGIDAHMGVLFGGFNQLLLMLTASGLIAMIVLGYVMSWLRWRAQIRKRPAATLLQALSALPIMLSLLIAVIAVVLGILLPVLGASLLVLIGMDALCTFNVLRLSGQSISPNA